MKPCDFKKLAQVFVKQYFPEYLDRVDRIWAMLDNVDFTRKDTGEVSQLQFGEALGFAAEANTSLREVISGLVAIRITYEQEKNTESMPLGELQKLIVEVCEKLKVSDNVKVKIERLSIDFDNKNHPDEIVNEIKTASNELKETIKQAHHKTRKQLNTPIVDHNYQTNWKVRIIKEQKRVIINMGREDKAFQFSNLQLDILLALAHHSLSKNHLQGFMYWEDLITKVSRWKIQEDSSIDDDDIRRHIMNIRNIFGNNYSQIIETKRLEGYRISTNPANISVE